MPSPASLDDALMDSFVAALEREPSFPASFFHFFFCTAVPPNLREGVKLILRPRRNRAKAYFNFLLPVSYFDDPMEVQKDGIPYPWLRGKPPSFSIAFFRSTVRLFAKPLPETMLKLIKGLFGSVFPEFAVPGLEPWSTATLEARIYRRLSVDDPIKGLRNLNRDSIDVYRTLMTNPVFKDKDRATRALLYLAISERATVAFTEAAIGEVCNFETEIVGFVSEPQFLNTGNLLNVAVAVKVVARRFGMPLLIEIVAIHIEDTTKKEALLNIGSRDGVDRLLANPVETPEIQVLMCIWTVKGLFRAIGSQIFMGSR
jgi:hypothetical protein